MTERSRRAYLSIAGVLLAIGGAGVAIGLVDAAFSLGLFRGSPVLTAAFVLAIGGALRWTALSAEVRRDDGGGGRDADDQEGDAAGRGSDDRGPDRHDPPPRA